MTRNTLSQIAAASALAVAALLPGMATAKAKALLPDTASAEVACTDSIRTDNLTLNLSYVSCTGSFADHMTEGTLSYGGIDYAFIGKSSNDGTGNGPFAAFGNDFNTGVLSFDQAWTGDFVLGIKAGDRHSFYRFVSDIGVSAIAFDTLGVDVNVQGIGKGISHVNLYGGEPVAAIPEPSTYALLLAGLGGVGFVARRRRNKR